MNSLNSICAAKQDSCVALRRRFHRVPEVRWEEEATMAMVMAEIEELRKISGVFGDTVVGKGGIYVDINPVSTEPSSTPTPNTRILLRADCDGLPVPEATGLPFTSTNGNSHACGHDMHMAMLLTAMRVFCARSPTFPLRCVFQRAEENPITKSGGAVMCSEDNVLQNIMEVYGLHVWATLPANKFYSRPAEILANSDRLRVSISCCGGHASNPSTTTNPIQVSANIISRLDGFDERTLPPQTVSALVPTILHSGTASNVIPNTAELWFGVRNFLPPSARSSFHEQLCQEVSNAASHFPLADLTVTPKIIPGHPATINSPTCVASLAANLRTHLAPGDVSTTTPPILGGEDFSHYLQARPGAFFLLGAHTPTSGDHHSPAFNPDERVLWRGVLYWCAIAYGAESESGESPDTTFLGSTREVIPYLYSLAGNWTQDADQSIHVEYPDTGNLDILGYLLFEDSHRLPVMTLENYSAYAGTADPIPGCLFDQPADFFSRGDLPACAAAEAARATLETRHGDCCFLPYDVYHEDEDGKPWLLTFEEYRKIARDDMEKDLIVRRKMVGLATVTVRVSSGGAAPRKMFKFN